MKTGQNKGGGTQTCTSTAAACGTANAMTAKVKAASWEIRTESHPFAGASRHTVGKEHNEHTAGLDVFSLEITAVGEAPINKLEAKADLINPYLESSPQVSMLLEIGLVSVKQYFSALGM